MSQYLKRTQRSRPQNIRMLSISAPTHALTSHYLLLGLLHIMRTIRANIMESKLSSMISRQIALRAPAICGLVLLRDVATGCTRVRQQMESRESRHILKLTHIKLRRRSILLTKKVAPTYLSSMFGHFLDFAVVLIISRNLVRRIQALAPESDSVISHDKTGHPSPIKIRF